MSLPSHSPLTWVVIVPVKETTIAKSRLGGVTQEQRRQLATAFALDTVSAAVACPYVSRVVVVTNDRGSSLFRDLGADVIPDAPSRGLNPALEYAALRVRSDGSNAIAAVSSDLPALVPDDLSVVLASDHDRWFVPDTAGEGTTILAARAGQPWQPHFGEQSRAAHRALGIAEITTPDLPRLRRDVDTPSDLDEARLLGVGRHTLAVLALLSGSG